MAGRPRGNRVKRQLMISEAVSALIDHYAALLKTSRSTVIELAVLKFAAKQNGAGPGELIELEEYL